MKEKIYSTGFNWYNGIYRNYRSCNWQRDMDLVSFGVREYHNHGCFQYNINA